MAQGHPDLVERSVACGHVLDLREDALRDHPRVAVAVDEISNATLATDIEAAEDQPAESHATMDGFAFDAADAYPYEVVDREVFPEDEPGSLEAGQAVRIATGAPLPAGANAVLKREEATLEDGELTGPSISPGTYVYERGSNVEAGELLYEDGERLAPRDAILLRDLGYDTVDVYERFSVGILATGTEIHEGRHRDLDSPMLSALVMRPFFTGDTGEHPTVDARVTCDLDIGAEGFEYVVPVELTDDRATPLGHESSSLTVYDDVFDPSVLSSSTRAIRADGFFVTESGVEEGERVDVVPYPVVE